MFNTIEPEEFEEMLHNQFADNIVYVGKQYDISEAEITLDKIKDAIQWMKEQGFTFLTSCNGIHYPHTEKVFCMVYHLYNMQRNLRVRLKVSNPIDPPHFPTITDIFPAANWMEREAYDFCGFKFDGHPDLRRILNEDSMEGWPLRKEYPLEDQARFDKDDKMFGR